MDRLCDGWGVGYIKIDYNVNAGPGTDTDVDSRGRVREGIAVYKALRADIPRGLSAWPTGLPGCGGGWATYALACGDVTYLAVWRRIAGAQARCVIPLARCAPRGYAEVLYLSGVPRESQWDAETRTLTVETARPPRVLLFRVR